MSDTTKPDFPGSIASPPGFRKPTLEELQNRYGYHPAVGDQGVRHQMVRDGALAFAKLVVDLTPCSPEQARALNAIDEAMMLANAAISRHG